MGTVTDTRGAALSGILVAALRADTYELARASVTDGTGHYDLGLAVGAELAGYAGTAPAIVSASGILPEAMGPLSTALRPALMINYEDDDGFVNYVPDPGADCARIVASGGDCTLHLLPGTGHAVDFVEQAPIVVPFLSRVLGAVSPPG